MKVGIEVHTLFARPRTGIQNYVWNILTALTRVAPDIQLVLYGPTKFDPSKLDGLPSATFRQGGSMFGFRGYYWTKFSSDKLILEDDIDVFLAPRTLYPFFIRSRVPVVPIVYDLAILVCPELMPKVAYPAFRLWFKRDILKADKVVAISRGTSDRLRDMVGRPADGVAYPAVSALYKPADPEAINGVRAKYGITSDYIVFVGTLGPLKNLEALLDAHSAVNSRRSSPLQLVLVGKRGWKSQRLLDRLDAGIPNVRELGYVPEGDLPALYTGAEALVMPSSYEGYGMPAAEARACGTRVVASDIPELREAAGPHATFVTPDVAGLAGGIEHALTAPPPEWTQPVSWEDSARVVYRVLREAAALKPTKRRNG